VAATAAAAAAGGGENDKGLLPASAVRTGRVELAGECSFLPWRG